MQIKDVMTKKVITADPQMGIGEVAKLLVKNRIHGMPVVENEEVIGIIVEDDFFSKSSVEIHLPSYIDLIKKTSIASELPDRERKKISDLINAQARDIMTKNCLCLNPWMDIKDALKIFKDTHLNTFPVVNEEKKLVGITTLADILNLF